MSLQQRLSDLITAIGADIKSITTALNASTQVHNASIVAQTNFAVDNYLVGSSVAIPQGKIQAKTKYRCKFNIVKTSTAGTATPIITVRVGTTASLSDASRAVLTFAAQTAVADEGVVEIEIAFRAAGATAVMQVNGNLQHRLAATGLSVANVSCPNATSAAFDITGAGLFIGISVNGGASVVWTVGFVNTELMNLAG